MGLLFCSLNSKEDFTVANRIRIEKKRLERFSVEPLKEFRTSLEQRPELKSQLEKDLKGTIEAEGIVIDDAFRQKVHNQWRSMIQADIRDKMDKLPDDKKRLYSMVRKGKPLKVKVKIDKTTGKRTITPEVKS